MLVNIIDRNNVRPILVSINTKFLNCLQLEWSKYVTMVHHNQTGDLVSYDVLYDYLVQFEPHVLASKAKKAAKNHDPLALLAHSNASSSQYHANSSYSPQPYYVTHPLSVVDYEDEYQGELQGDSQEDKLTTAMMLLARAITQKFSTPTNNHLRTSSNVITDIESDLEEAPSEAEESEPLGSRVPLMSEEFEASKPSGTRTVSSYSPVSSDSTSPLSPDHPLTHVSPTPTPARVLFHCRTARMVVRTQSTLSPGISARIAEAAALSPSSFRKRYRSSYETSSSSLTLPVRKRYQGTSEVIIDTDSEGDELGEEDTKEDESLNADNEREGQDLDDEAVPVADTAMSVPLGLGYGATRRRSLESIEEIAPSTFEVDPEDDRVYTDIPAYAPPAAPVQTPPSPEWSLDSLPISPSSSIAPSPIASPVATPIATISVDEDQFLEVGAQLELHGSILYDHTQRLDALPPTLLANIDKDMRELYTRSGAVRDEIFSQRHGVLTPDWQTCHGLGRVAALEQERDRKEP
ncbi:hypothetical protein Tco_0969825 [Tanacetum coccineum]